MSLPFKASISVTERASLDIQAKLKLDFAPYRLSRTVYSVLLNDQRFVTGLGDNVLQAPYKGSPQAAVLAVRPRNCWAGDGDAIRVDGPTTANPSQAITGVAQTQIQTGACFGLVIKRDLCFLQQNKTEAMVPETTIEPLSPLLTDSHGSPLLLSDLIAGVCLANDCSLLIESHYRPAIRQKARDGFCVFAEKVLPFESMYQERSFALLIDGELQQRQNGLLCHEHVQRSIEHLLVAITDFMTLKAGDILLLGPSFRSPIAHIGQTIELRSPQFGSIQNTVVSV
jgi:5-oxopent-3-ene-1,2,5-tricarboxylate decarboxylase / 2-hydroxyhepta-2,4-diene-1,7-dioate isomerase